MTEPASCKELLIELSKTLNAENARGLNADILFVFSGSEKGEYYLHLENGKCTLHTGSLDYARLTIRVDADVWRDIQGGKIPWSEAMMQRKFIATGNFPLLARLPQLFKLD